MLDISIIIPCYNEELFIENCIHSILNFTLEKGKYEIILIDGDSTDNTRDIITRLKEKYSQIKLLINKERTVPYALNMGIKEAKGNIIVRMDAHSIYPSDYISVLVDLLRSEDVDNVGGIVETLPADKTTKSQCIAIASSHKFGVGDSHFRIGSKEIRKVDTVPFGCFKKEIFSEVGLFDLDLTRNQDDEFNARIIKKGGVILLNPAVKIKYFARNTFSSLYNMFYQYGLYKPLVNKKLQRVSTIRQLIPPLFVIGLIFGGLFSFFNINAAILYILVLFLYSILLLSIAIKSIKSVKDLKKIFLLPYSFLIIHTSYGLGYIKGIFEFIVMKKDNLKKIKSSR